MFTGQVVSVLDPSKAVVMVLFVLCVALWLLVALLFSCLSYCCFNSEHSSRRAKRVANEVSSTVENMIKEKLHTTIYTFSSNRSDQFSSVFSSRKLHRKLKDLIMGLTKKRHEVTERMSISVTNIFCWLFLLFIIDLHNIFIYWYSFFNDAWKGSWSVQI